MLQLNPNLEGGEPNWYLNWRKLLSDTFVDALKLKRSFGHASHQLWRMIWKFEDELYVLAFALDSFVGFSIVKQNKLSWNSSWSSVLQLLHAIDHYHHLLLRYQIPILTPFDYCYPNQKWSQGMWSLKSVSKYVCPLIPRYEHMLLLKQIKVLQLTFYNGLSLSVLLSSG